MLSVRVTRDRRGYDHVYLIEETRRRGRPEGRLVYWSRMPGGLRVGREPFDDETRAALERANPGVNFDWASLLKSLNASAAAARWNARQQQPRPTAPPPSTPRGDRGRSAPRPSPPRRSWREDDDDAAEDAEGPTARRESVASDLPEPAPVEAGSGEEPPTV